MTKIQIQTMHHLQANFYYTTISHSLLFWMENYEENINLVGKKYVIF